MQSISDLFTQRPVVIEIRKRRTERGDLLEYFRDKINFERVGTKYPPSTIKTLAGRFLWHIKDIHTLYFIKSLCDQEEKRGKSWSKVFFGSIKYPVDNSGIAIERRGGV